LDLEVLAAHRGSVLGDLPDAPQPSQKSFETAIWSTLSSFDSSLPVFVESESKKVGNLRVPEALIERMRQSPCIRLEAGERERVALLREDYSHFESRREALAEKLDILMPLHGSERIAHWKSLLEAGDWDALVRDLLENHYDPAYRKSLFRNYKHAQAGEAVPVNGISRAAFLALARRLIS
jgi:tRNA 2-selenouridine synthase